MEATIISLLISVLSILQNPSIPVEQKIKIYNQVVPIVQNMTRELHDKADKAEALRIEEMKKAEAINATPQTSPKPETDYVGPLH